MKMTCNLRDESVGEIVTERRISWGNRNREKGRGGRAFKERWEEGLNSNHQLMHIHEKSSLLKEMITPREKELGAA